LRLLAFDFAFAFAFDLLSFGLSKVLNIDVAYGLVFIMHTAHHPHSSSMQIATGR